MQLEPLPPVTTRQIIMRGLHGTCPNCGKAKLFRSTIKINYRCPNCAMILERGDGFYLGPLCINYGLVVFGFVAPLLFAGFLQWMPFAVSLVISLLGALILPVLFYRHCWSLWLMIYYICLPHELHANHPEDSDDLSFEEEKRS